MHLIFDFDGTLTERDTISTLANFALAHHKSQIGHDNDNLSLLWKQAVAAYLSDYQRFKQAYVPAEDQRTCVDDEVKFLAGSQEVERASLRRVEASRVFAGLDGDLLFGFGVGAVKAGDVRVREGFGELVRFAEGKGWGVGVISVNWSCCFIRGVLSCCFDEEASMEDITVIANEVTPGSGCIVGPVGVLSPGGNGDAGGGGCLTNSGGKLEALKSKFVGPTVYFGDSVTDLECLLRGGVAIGEGEESELVRTLRRIGFVVPHVGEVEEAGVTEKVFWARNLKEVLESGVLLRWEIEKEEDFVANKEEV